MPHQFELTVLPLHRRDGQDHSYLPGLLAMEAPRRAARGRSGERLVLQLTVAEDAGLRPEQQKSLLQDMASGYFRTPGAVTSALVNRPSGIDTSTRLLSRLRASDSNRTRISS